MPHPRCPALGCQSHLIPLWRVVFIVVIVSTFAIIFPFLDAIGLAPGQVIVLSVQNYVIACLLIMLWLLTIVVSTARKHEHVFECLIDTFGIPGFIGSVIFFGKGVGIHF
jgi:hypothetical protein